MRQLIVHFILCASFSGAVLAQADQKQELRGDMEFQEGIEHLKRKFLVQFKDVKSNDQIVWTRENYDRDGKRGLVVRKTYKTADGYPRVDRATGVTTIKALQITEGWNGESHDFDPKGQMSMIIFTLEPIAEKKGEKPHRFKLTAKFNYAMATDGTITWLDLVHRNDNFVVGTTSKRKIKDR